jgi:hypothetical protein
MTILAALAALLAFASSPAKASFTTDDRYFDSRTSVKPTAYKRAVVKRSTYKKRHVRHIAQRKSVSRPLSLPHDRFTLTTTDEQLQDHRETTHYMPVPDVAPVVVHGSRPRAWCGWWLGRQLGLLSRSLWLASNWATVGAPTTKHVGAIVVWRHHVGKITAVRHDGAIKVLSGNDGHAVRDRWRSARGVIAYRAL